MKFTVPAPIASLLTLAGLGSCSVSPAAETTPSFNVKLETVRSGFDRKTCWVHARAGAIPGEPPLVVLTMQKLLLSGSDVFYALHHLETKDLGASWSEPRPHRETLGRREEPGGTVVATCDFTPRWHAATGKLLGTGQTVRYEHNRVMKVRNREISYAVFSPDDGSWTPWTPVDLPDERRFLNAGAGSVQRHDLPNGDILLPIYFKEPEQRQYHVAVLRCRFDGEKLTYLEHGNEMTVPAKRGLAEPSLTRFGDRYYLTLRNDEAGYVTSGMDGLHFEKPVKWRFDDDSELGSYNTQQHWVTHSGGLFLVYTRRGANNDHVFRHRAPLFIAQVDPGRLRVIRATERILVPERGARLGNFGVVDVSPQETWITVTEWMQTTAPDPHDYRVPMKYGSDNALFVARIRWDEPNELMTPTAADARSPAAGTTRYRVEPVDSSVRDSFLASKRAAQVLVHPDHNIWGCSVIRWSDGRYHAYFARWPRSTGHAGWLTHCSIMHGVSDRPEGPYETAGTAVEARPVGHDGVINAHNPCICPADGRLHLYYISNKLTGLLPQGDDAQIDAWLKGNRLPTVRNAQVTYVATARNPNGPFVRSSSPAVDPADHPGFKNIAVNPAVIHRDGEFRMIIKGDDPAREEWHRIQLVGAAGKAQGPFTFEKSPVYAERQTEDACLWYNQADRTYNMVCHVMGTADLAWFVAKDGRNWQPADPPVFMKKEIPLTDGTVWKPRRVERPFVLTNDKGEPQMIFVSVADGGINGNIALKLTPDLP